MMNFKDVVLKLLRENSKEICFSLDKDYLKPV